MYLQLICVRSVTHQSARVTRDSSQCPDTNGWAQSLVHQKSRQCSPPLQGVSASDTFILTPCYTQTEFVCPNNSGDRILSIQSTIIQIIFIQSRIQIMPSKAWFKCFIFIFPKLQCYIFWQTCASDPTLSISPENFLLFSHLLSQCLSFYDSSL